MPPIATIRVLIVDDDEDDRRLISELLGEAKRASFIVDEAGTTDAAFSAVRTTTYDVIFVDFRLTNDISGLDFIRGLNAGHFRVPCILITNQKDRRLQAEALEAGASEFLEKGNFGADILERTCLYVIGLHEKASQTHNGGSFAEIVALTRDSVEAQVRTADGVAGLRQEMQSLKSSIKEDVQGLVKHVDDLRQHADQQKADILEKLSEGAWGRLVDLGIWCSRHPVKAAFLGLSIVTFFGIIAIEIVYLGPDLVKLLLGGG